MRAKKKRKKKKTKENKKKRKKRRKAVAFRVGCGWLALAGGNWG